MKLNEKGFAISSMLYSILLLFLMLIVGVLAILGNRKVILDKIKNEIVTDLTQNKTYSFSFAHKDILLANTSMVSNFSFDLLDDVKVVDQNGNIIKTEITTTSNPTFDATKNGTYVITYSANYQGNIIEEERTIEVIDPITYEYTYTGKKQQFTVPTNGLYQMELWGAEGGGTNAGKGAYVKGNIGLNINTQLHIFVGEHPTHVDSECSATSPNSSFNGTINGGCAGGGGATDIRLDITSTWNDTTSLTSRIIVAGGGGGAYYTGSGGAGGEINALDGVGNGTNPGFTVGKGATQSLYTFGIGGSGSTTNGGGGYYGGQKGYEGNAGGGSSYISGYRGSIAIRSNTDITPICESVEASANEKCSYHYSGYKFTNMQMIGGDKEMVSPTGESETGHSGDGYARITALIIDNGKVATNLVKNSGFEETTGWTLSNANIVSDISKSGNSSLQFQSGVTSMISQNTSSPIASHVYYGSVEFLSTGTFSASDDRFEMYQSDTENGTVVFARKSNQTAEWMKLSSIQGLQSPNSGTWKIRNFLVDATETAYVDNLFIIDLTEIYGAGNEPTKQWCDANIHYFDGVGIVPSY
ncbi:MAG: hypothetical protein HFH08_01810 [Bacilli bacterium]|nr:hypothetical protein [Bacilli bacterium]